MRTVTRCGFRGFARLLSAIRLAAVNSPNRANLAPNARPVELTRREPDYAAIHPAIWRAAVHTPAEYSQLPQFHQPTIALPGRQRRPPRTSMLPS